jgi:hypothetical protein
VEGGAAEEGGGVEGGEGEEGVGEGGGEEEGGVEGGEGEEEEPRKTSRYGELIRIISYKFPPMQYTLSVLLSHYLTVLILPLNFTNYTP